MIILNKKEFKQLLNDNPNKKYMFCEYTPEVFVNDFHITSGNSKYPDFGATSLSIEDNGEFAELETFFYDWNINEYTDNDLFAVFSKNDVLELISLFKNVVNGDVLEEG